MELDAELTAQLRRVLASLEVLLPKPVPPIDWSIILPAYALVYLAAWLIISLHLWVSARWPSLRPRGSRECGPATRPESTT